MPEKIEGGYIVLARRILDDDIMDKPIAWRWIWIHILLNVNWKDTDRLKRGQGFFCWQNEKHRLRGVSRDVWVKATHGLQRDGKIALQKAQHGSIITVLKYDTYQDLTRYQSTTKSTTKAQLKHNRSTTLYKKEGKEGKEGNNYLGKISAIWFHQFKVPINYGKWGKYLKPLIEKFGGDDVVERFKSYMQMRRVTKSTHFARPDDFAEKYGDWKPHMQFNPVKKGWEAIDYS